MTNPSKQLNNADPENKREMSKATKLIGSLGFKIAIVAVILAVLYIGTSRGYSFGYDLFTQKAVDEAPGQDVIVTVYEDMSEREVADLLHSKGLISNESYFIIFEKLFTSERFGIIPGEYTLNTSMTPRELLSAISGVIEAETSAAPTLGLYETEGESESEGKTS